VVADELDAAQHLPKRNVNTGFTRRC
jgi:hypothetical protein